MTTFSPLERSGTEGIGDLHVAEQHSDSELGEDRNFFSFWLIYGKWWANSSSLLPPPSRGQREHTPLNRNYTELCAPFTDKDKQMLVTEPQSEICLLFTRLNKQRSK